MPEVFRRQLADGSLREALFLARAEFLPEEIRNDKNANWVLSFDELQRKSGQEAQFRGRPNDSALWAFDLIVSSTLQRRIPYFFAALFHIGRQWKVSASALQSLEKASDPKNVDDTVRLTLESLRELATSDKQVAELYNREGRDTAEALSLVLKSSREQHVSRLRDAQHWWGIWLEEVDTLRSQVNRLQEFGFGDADYRLSREVVTFLAAGYRPSGLHATMESAGVKFTAEIERNVSSLSHAYSEMLTPLLLLSLTSNRKDPFLHEVMFEWRYVFHDLKRDIEYGESRRIGLERLKEKYRHRDDPFEPYLPLANAATEALRNLVIEHELPGNQSSPWLAAWQRGVEYNPATASAVPFKDIRDPNVIRAFARAADAAIKQALPNDYLPGESWDNLVQRLFELAWVSSVADQIVNTSKKDPSSKWTFDSFVSLIEEVVKALREIGYTVAAPASTRLKTLWERLHSDKPYSTDEW
jgi:hypothetical protein